MKSPYPVFNILYTISLILLFPFVFPFSHFSQFPIYRTRVTGSSPELYPILCMSTVYLVLHESVRSLILSISPPDRTSSHAEIIATLKNEQVSFELD